MLFVVKIIEKRRGEFKGMYRGGTGFYGLLITGIRELGAGSWELGVGNRE
jgi:hypothetical protein